MSSSLPLRVGHRDENQQHFFQFVGFKEELYEEVGVKGSRSLI